MTEKYTSKIERRREIRRENRIFFLKEFWRFFIFSSTFCILTILLLRYGWNIKNKSQLLITGDTGVTPDSLLKLNGISLPKEIMQIKIKVF